MDDGINQIVENIIRDKLSIRIKKDSDGDLVVILKMGDDTISEDFVIMKERRT